MSAENGTMCDCFEAANSRLKALPSRESFDAEKARANRGKRLEIKNVLQHQISAGAARRLEDGRLEYLRDKGDVDAIVARAEARTAEINAKLQAQTEESLLAGAGQGPGDSGGIRDWGFDAEEVEKDQTICLSGKWRRIFKSINSHTALGWLPSGQAST